MNGKQASSILRGVILTSAPEFHLSSPWRSTTQAWPNLLSWALLSTSPDSALEGANRSSSLTGSFIFIVFFVFRVTGYFFASERFNPLPFLRLPLRKESLYLTVLVNVLYLKHWCKVEGTMPFAWIQGLPSKRLLEVSFSITEQVTSVLRSAIWHLRRILPIVL